MREEAAPWVSSARAAPTLPNAGRAARLAARALQETRAILTQVEEQTGVEDHAVNRLPQ